VTCKRCGTKMQQLAHVAHGQRKFKCRNCGGSRMQKAKIRKDRKSRKHLRESAS